MKDDLYHQALLDLARRAREQPRLAAADVSVTVDNPLCGDRISLDLAISGARVEQVGHKTRGCILCQAAAAVIADRAPGTEMSVLGAIAGKIRGLLEADDADLAALWPELGAFAPVRSYKSRHDCVILPFSALADALARLDDGRQRGQEMSEGNRDDSQGALRTYSKNR